MSQYLADYFTANTSSFWADLTLINQSVSKLLADASDDDIEGLCGIQTAVRAKVDPDRQVAHRLLDFGNALLSLLRLPLLGKDEESPNGFAPAAAAAIEPERRAQTDTEKPNEESLQTDLPYLRKHVNAGYEEVLMEYLTGVWLGLYFLGTPMAQPWDRVRMLAEQVGGVPSGPCMYKYIGDIYRTARQQVIREKGEGVILAQRGPTTRWKEANPLYVLTYRPLALLEDDIARAPVRNLTPATLQSLGQRYAVLQMRLYTKQHFPTKYFVPERALGRSIAYMLAEHSRASNLADFKAKIVYELEPTAKKIYNAIKKNFCSPSEQSVRLLEPAHTASFPTCVLGAKTGVYSLDGSQAVLHFTGNQVRQQLLHAYRLKLSELNTLAGEKMETNMLNWSEGEILEKIEVLVYGAVVDPTFRPARFY